MTETSISKLEALRDEADRVCMLTGLKFTVDEDKGRAGCFALKSLSGVVQMPHTFDGINGYLDALSYAHLKGWLI
jgi:hypothetical protein